MRIVCISDTHEFHNDIEIPNGDVLIHAGDIAHVSGTSALRKFNSWLGEQPHRFKVVVPGNHDAELEDPDERGVIANAKLLVNSGVRIQGIRIWGSPVTPLPGEPFGMPNAADRRRLWAKIPDDTDVLVTHTPAFGILDQEKGSNVHQGDPELLAAIERVQPRYHVCGHVHGGYGTHRSAHTIHINAALNDEIGSENCKAIVFDL